MEQRYGRSGFRSSLSRQLLLDNNDGEAKRFSHIPTFPAYFLSHLLGILSTVHADTNHIHSAVTVVGRRVLR